MSHDTGLHMSFCTGEHEYGDCLVEVELDHSHPELGPSGYTLRGTHCSDVALAFDCWARTPEDLDNLLTQLAQLRPLLEAAQPDVDCNRHPDRHPEDDEDEEDDGPYPQTCAGCGATVEDWWHAGTHGYLGISCGCLTAAGYRESEDGTKLERI